MSEDRLFQQVDEQEAIYAPRQLPDGTPGEQAAAIEGDANTSDNAVPAIALAGGANTGGLGPSVSTTGTASGIAPAAGLAGLTSDDQDDANK